MGGKGLIALFGGLAVLGGYTLVWYGWACLAGVAGPGVASGISLTDLLFPSKVAQVDSKLGARSPAPTPIVVPIDVSLPPSVTYTPGPAGGQYPIQPTNPVKPGGRPRNPGYLPKGL